MGGSLPGADEIDIPVFVFILPFMNSASRRRVTVWCYILPIVFLVHLTACGGNATLETTNNGKIYFVDMTGGIDTNSGMAMDNAWKTISKVNSSSFSPGDTILFKRGETWREQLVISSSGNTGNPITYGAYGTGALPEIVGSGSDYALSVDSRNNVTIQDFEFNNDGYTAIRMTSLSRTNHSNTIQRCKIVVTGSNPGAYSIQMYLTNPFYSLNILNNEITNPSGQGLRVEAFGVSLYDMNISYNDFHDIGLQAIRFFDMEEYVSSTSSPYGISIDHNTFTDIKRSAIETTAGMRHVEGYPNYIGYNTALRIGSDAVPNVNAFQLNWIRSAIIEHNFIDTIRTSAPDGDGIILDFSFSDNNYMCDDLIVRYNTVTGANASFGRTSGINVIAVTNSSIHHNILYNNQIGISLTTSMPSGNVFFNNVMDDNFYGALETHANLGHGDAPASIWENNIFSNNKVGFYVQKGSAPPTESYNLFHGNINDNNIWLIEKGNQALSGTDKTGNPSFFNRSLRDYRITSSSAARDAGIFVGVTSDILGNPVPGGIATDIGAYEINF
jgi:parallel beta-helix repeat protein